MDLDDEEDERRKRSTDEACSEDSECGDDARCANTESGLRCECNDGFTGRGGFIARFPIPRKPQSQGKIQCYLSKKSVKKKP